MPTFHTIVVLGEIIGFLFVPIVLSQKRNPVSAIAWSLTVISFPYFGILFYLAFGASRVRRRIQKKIIHRSKFFKEWATPGLLEGEIDPNRGWDDLDRFALKIGGATPMTHGNSIQFFDNGITTFQEKIAAIEAATDHIHLEYYIMRNDTSGNELIDLLCQKAQSGVEVRLLLDAIGSIGSESLLKRLRQAGGKTAYFLPADIFAPRFHLSLRNHRKILVCDGKVGFVGGLNIGDEYLGKVPHFGPWRDTHARLMGPAVLTLQRIFIEDWDFASGERLSGKRYFPLPGQNGSTRIQIVWSGPDQEINATKTIFFEAFNASMKSIWIATPYFIPDSAMLMAIRTAALRGVEVKLLTQTNPADHFLTYWAGRYFWEDLLSSGVRIFEYDKGMMHAKVILVDGEWASIGSSNMDIRSFRLNFEVNCQIHTPTVVQELERMFDRDLSQSREILHKKFRKRPFSEHLLENFCRLFSPLL